MNEFSELWLTISWRRDRKTEREREREIGFCFGVCDSVVWDWGGIEIRVFIYIYIYSIYLSDELMRACKDVSFHT